MALKIWHNGKLKTQDQAWADQSPYEIYRDACQRMESPTTGYDQDLSYRWPTLGDANKAMVSAYKAMPAEARAYEDAIAFADLTILSL